MRLVVRVAWSLFAAGLLSCAWGADEFPSRPLRIVVPFAPGGVGDLTARILAQKLSERLNQQMIVDNRPSAGGVVAADMVARAEPDGHTMLLLNSQQALSVSLFKSLTYDPVRDFRGVSTVGSFSLAFLVTPNSQLKSLTDLIALAKAHPAKLNAGTTNVGASQHLAAELFKSMAGVNVVIVPYTSTGAMLTAVRSNDVQFGLEILAPVIGQVKSGSLRVLAVTTAQRSPLLAEVPTVSESGVPGYEVTSWNGVAVPARTPRSRVTRLNEAVIAALASADVRQRFQDLGVEPRPSTPEAFEQHLKAEIGKWRTVIDNARIPKQ